MSGKDGKLRRLPDAAFSHPSRLRPFSQGSTPERWKPGSSRTKHHGEKKREVMNTIGDRKLCREPPLFPDLLPSNTIPVSKSLRALETTRLCRGRCDSNYIICPICYCFIHVRIICFGFLCNVWGFVCGP